MGDDSPDEIELVCTSCDTEFIHEGETGRLPSVPCPECGEPVSLQGSDPEEAGDEESPPAAQVVGASDGPSPPEGADDTTQTLMGVGPQAATPDDDQEQDGSEPGELEGDPGDSEGDDGDGTPLAKISSAKRRADTGDGDEDSADDSAGDESTLEESGGEESADRSFAGASDDDVHDRETSVSREPLSKMSPDGESEGGDSTETGSVGDESSDGGRLSDLKRRLQQARHKEDDEAGDGENPFTDAAGSVGGEETRVAADSGLDEGFGDEPEPDEAMEVTVEEDDETGDSGAGESIPEPDVEFGGGDEPQDPRDENRETKPAGEDTILETMQSGGEDDGADESVETAEQSLPEEAVETTEQVDPNEADTAERPAADADEETPSEDAPAIEEMTDGGAGEPSAEASDSGDEGEATDESAKETKPQGDGGELGGIPGPDEMDEASELGGDSSVPSPEEVGGGDDGAESDSGGESPSDIGLGGSSSVPHPGEVRAGNDQESEDEETSSADGELESGSEARAMSADVDEETPEVAEEDEEDVDLEQMSREMADEASDIISEMRDEGDLEAEPAVEDEEGDGETGDSGVPPVPDEPDAAETSGSGAPPVADDVGAESDDEPSGEEAGANPPPKPDAGSGSVSPPESDSRDEESEPTGRTGDAGAGAAAETDRSGEELPKPVAEAEVEFPDTSPGDGSPEPSQTTSSPSAADQPEIPQPSTTGADEKPDLEPVSEESGGGSNMAIIGAALAGVVLVGAGIFFLVDPMGLQQGGGEESPEKVADKQKTKKKDTGAQKNKKVGEAVQSARSTVGEATAVDASDADLQRQVAGRLAERGEAGAASRIYDVLWDRSAEDTELANRYIDLLMEAERFRQARLVAIQAMGFADEGAGFEAKFDETLEADETLGSWEPVELDEMSGLASIGASSDVDYSGLVLRGDGGEPVGLWRPATDEDGPWRDSIAAWRLCQIVACPFEIPRTRPSRISRSAFEAKFDGESGELDSGEFNWVTREGPDGGEVEYLYGALRDWPGEVTRWPIEEFGVWRPWLVAGNDPSSMDQPIEEEIGDFEELGDGSLYEGVVAESSGLEVRTVARQLSGIIAFDYLTNNWGRFEDDEVDYGASNHFADGRFVTMETDTVFQRRKSTRVKGRFRWISRFSGDMVRSIRLLDKQSTREMLYPDASAIERAKFDIFWEQRDALLSRVDELSDEHGRDDVLLFQ
jgi:hypothetical protein